MSINVVVDTHGLEAKFAAAPAQINAGLERVVMGATIDAEGAVISATPVGATGFLRQSITHSFSGSGVAMMGRVYSSDVPLKVASVETGRAPGKMPPAAPIAMWAQRKLGLEGAELRSATFLIQRAIGKRGTKPVGMFKRGAETARASVARRMTAFTAELRGLL